VPMPKTGVTCLSARACYRWQNCGMGRLEIGGTHEDQAAYGNSPFVRCSRSGFRSALRAPWKCVIRLQQKVTVSGIVIDFLWANPHSILRFDAKDDKGEVTHWTVEAGGPPDMARQGWAHNSFKPGDQVTVTVIQAKNGDPIGRFVGSGNIILNGKPFPPGSGNSSAALQPHPIHEGDSGRNQRLAARLQGRILEPPEELQMLKRVFHWMLVLIAASSLPALLRAQTAAGERVRR